jgi:hypothetical protein
MDDDLTAQLEQHFAEMPAAQKEIWLEVIERTRTTPLTVEEVRRRLGSDTKRHP